MAFLFTDVEGSTRLWETDPTDTNRAIAIHDAILRKEIASHHGHVFSTGGDAFCAAFASVRAALEAGLAAQLGLVGVEASGEPLRVRMAIHVGEAEERDGDYFGPVLNRCARLMAAGHGGQLLLSGAAAELAEQNLPERLVLVDLGEHRLKDLSASERIFEVRHPDLGPAFPPLRTLDVVLNNLPSQVTAFFGREREVADIGRLMTDHRLVTITGVGGGGKTRLALQVAAEMLDRFPHGVWLVNLAPITDPALVADTIATALGFRPPPTKPVIDSLETYLLDRTSLLLMDNCEHLIDQVASVVSRLITATKTTSVLATSRERLGITGEWLCPIRPLPPPEPDSDRALVEANPAVQMFVDRATALNSSFSVSSERLLAIADICRRLDGIPLAIELAAARTISLSPQQIASHLDQRLRILTVGDRTAPPHHQTLRATIDWSYQLLNPSERTLFHRLGIFRGTFSLEAAQEICSDTSLPPIDVIDLLPALVEESLVTVDHSPTATRYRLLETISEYAAEQLTTAGETEPVRRGHASYYLKLAEEAEPGLRTAKHRDLGTALELEHDNFRQALQWAIDTDQTEIGLRLAGALYRFWLQTSHILEGRRWLDALLAVDNPVADFVRAKALAGAGALVIERQDMPYAISCLEEAADIYRHLADQGQAHLELAAVVHNLALHLFFGLGDIERAEPLFEEALELMREAGTDWGVSLTLQNLGILALRKGELGRARDLTDEALAVSRELGSWRVALASVVASVVDLEFGDYAAAVHHLEQAIKGYVEADDPTQAQYARAGLGLAHLAAGNVASAVELFIPSANAVLADPEYQLRTGVTLELAIGRVGIDLALGNPDRAAILLGAIDQQLNQGATFDYSNTYERYRGQTEGLLDPDTFEQHLVSGAQMTREQVWSLTTQPIPPNDTGLSNSSSSDLP